MEYCCQFGCSECGPHEEPPCNGCYFGCSGCLPEYTEALFNASEVSLFVSDPGGREVYA